MSEIPKPIDTGSSGTQIISDSSIPQSESPLAGLPIVLTVEGLAATRSRSFGGEVGAQLLAGCFSQLQHEQTGTKKELAECREQLNEVKENHTNARIENARLLGEIDSLNNEKIIRNICLVAGTAIAAFGIDQFNNSKTNIGLSLIGLGVALCLVGWFSVGRRIAK